MKGQMAKYALLLGAVIVVAVFIYPGLYEYDKLDQKYPVKINRLTGHTEVLMGTEWVPTDNKDVAEINELEDLKKQIANQLQQDREQVKQEVITEIKDDIINQLKDEIAATKVEIEKYKAHELDPTTYFTVGDSKDTVKKIMGSPDSIRKQEYQNEEIWSYGTSNVTFKDGKVKEWLDFSKTLRTK